MDLTERRQRNEASRQRLARIQAERQPTARRGKSRQPASKIEQLQHRHTRLADRQQPLFRTLIQLPPGTSLPLSPRWRSWIGGLVASHELTIRVQGRRIAIARRGEPVPEFILDAIHDHVGPLAAWLRSRSCPDCGRTVRLQPISDATDGAHRWAIACPGCQRVLRSP